jgi:ankyrin repeat protein
MNRYLVAAAVFAPVLSVLGPVKAQAQRQQNELQAVAQAIYSFEQAELEKLLKRSPMLAKARDNRGFAALHYAAMASNLPAVELLLKLEADPNQGTQQGQTPLHFAVQYGWASEGPRLRIAEALLRAGARVDAADVAERNTPLHFAVSSGNIDQVRLLMVHGANPRVRNRQNQTPLDWMFDESRKKAIGELLNANYRDGNLRLPEGGTLLHWAVANGLDYTTAVLLQRKAEVHAKDPQGLTPLMLACRDGHEAVALRLLQAGARADETFADGETCLHAAAWAGSGPIVAALLRAGADPHRGDASQHTPLHLAAWNGGTEAVRALLQHKADPNAQAGGYTPLHAAAWNGHVEIVRLLLDAGAQIDARDADGLTALHKAAWRGHAEVVALLIQRKADVNARDNDQFTPLTKARSGGHEAVAALLAQAGGKQ